MSGHYSARPIPVPAYPIWSLDSSYSCGCSDGGQRICHLEDKSCPYYIEEHDMGATIPLCSRGLGDCVSDTAIWTKVDNDIRTQSGANASIRALADRRNST